MASLGELISSKKISDLYPQRSKWSEEDARIVGSDLTQAICELLPRTGPLFPRDPNLGCARIELLNRQEQVRVWTKTVPGPDGLRRQLEVSVTNTPLNRNPRGSVRFCSHVNFAGEVSSVRTNHDYNEPEASPIHKALVLMDVFSVLRDRPIVSQPRDGTFPFPEKFDQPPEWGRNKKDYPIKLGLQGELEGICKSMVFGIAYDLMNDDRGPLHPDDLGLRTAVLDLAPNKTRVFVSTSSLNSNPRVYYDPRHAEVEVHVTSITKEGDIEPWWAMRAATNSRLFWYTGVPYENMHPNQSGIEYGILPVLALINDATDAMKPPKLTPRSSYLS